MESECSGRETGEGRRDVGLRSSRRVGGGV